VATRELIGSDHISWQMIRLAIG